jgi:hypothetical protein
MSRSLGIDDCDCLCMGLPASISSRFNPIQCILRMSTIVPPPGVSKLTIPPRTPNNAVGVTPTSHRSLSSTSSGVISANEFGNGFDMKGWINAQLANRETGTKVSTPMDAALTSHSHSDLSATTAHLSSLLMKLQLLASDVSTSMEDRSAELVGAMPKAVREIGFIHRESQNLRANLTDILKEMTNMDSGKLTGTGSGGTNGGNGTTSAADTIEFLQSIDVVKGRILRCAHTLEEVDTWRKREALVEKLFDGIQITAPPSNSSATEGGATALVVPFSAFSDIARIHRELHVMHSIVDRFRSLGFGPGSEHETRMATVTAYETRLTHVTELCLDNAMDMLQEEGGDIAALQQLTVDSDTSSASAAAVAASSSPAVQSLQTLHALYCSGQLKGLTREGFERKYYASKIKRSWSAQIAARYATPPTAAATDAKMMLNWLSTMYTAVVSFVSNELHFAKSLFGSASAVAACVAALSSANSQPERSRFAIADEWQEKSAAAAANAITAPAANVGVDGATSGVSVSVSFVYTGVLDCLHQELTPLLSSSFATFMGNNVEKNSIAVHKLIQLWELTLNQLGWPIANILFPSAQSDTHTPTLQSSDWSETQSHNAQAQLLDVLLHPLSPFLASYAALEKSCLIGGLDSAWSEVPTLASSHSPSFEDAANALAEVHRTVLAHSAQAQQRCIQLSAGALTDPLLHGLQDAYIQYAQHMGALLHRLRRSAGLDVTNVTNKASKLNASPDASDELSSAEASAAAVASADAAASLSQNDSDWASLSGCFLLLRTARSIQWDLFAPHVESELMIRLAEHTGLVQLLKHVEEEKEWRMNQRNFGTDAPSPAVRKLSSAAIEANIRRNSLTAASPRLTGMTGPTIPATTLTVAPNNHVSPFPSIDAFSRMLFVSFLLAHPSFLSSLRTLVHRELLVHRPSLLSQVLTSAQTYELESGSHGTLGLLSHPAAPVLTNTTGSVTPAANRSSIVAPTGSKYGFPSAVSVGGLASSGALSISSPNGTGSFGLTSTSASSSAAPAVASAPPSSHLFPGAAAEMDAFIGQLHGLIYDTMFRSIARLLHGFASWNHIWGSSGTAGVSGTLLSAIPLPSFSMQPSDYIVHIGEHLLTLVQQLEPFTKGSEEEEENSNATTPVGKHTPVSLTDTSTSASVPPSYVESDALYWLQLLSRGTFRLLLTSVLSLTILTDKGARQLSTDIEYLVNVLSALGLSMPPLVLKLSLWLSWNESNTLMKLSQGSAGEEWTLDGLAAEEKHMLRHVLKCRRFKNIDPHALTTLNQ